MVIVKAFGHKLLTTTTVHVSSYLVCIQSYARSWAVLVPHAFRIIRLAPPLFLLLIVLVYLDYHCVGLSNVVSVSNACSMMSMANSSKYRS